ncbi:MAG: bifunctional folylpolyglutamate synthase/dihydrofolate synthase [Lentihominibacter sp.]|jgi:dihydrofolate synthase/folylpolyglutamate synthase
MTTVVDKFHEFDKFGSILGLERINELLYRLGNPHLGLRYIHVAGTNGKGSTCKYLEQGLAACGYSVGLYTSPYIEIFNERIQCDGQLITDDELELYGNQVLTAAAEMVRDGLDSPTEFELVMATAFVHFKAKKPDIVILEAGMGGIGDATNVIREPLASVFTNVDFDHMHVLGNTLAEIATDKAGIIKPGCPVISNIGVFGINAEERGVADQTREAAAVIARTAYEKDCVFYDISKIEATVDWATPFRQQVSMSLWGTDYSEIVTAMVGRHQAENLKTALAVIEVLRKSREIRVERSALYEGLKIAVQPGRFEIMRDGAEAGGEGPMYIIDGAHNDAGASALADTMNRYFSGKRTLLVCGMVEKKETYKVLMHFANIAADFIITQPNYEGLAMTASQLAKYMEGVREETGKEIVIRGTARNPQESVEIAGKIDGDYDVVLFTGSLYLIGEIRSILRKADKYDYDRTLSTGGIDK